MTASPGAVLRHLVRNKLTPRWRQRLHIRSARLTGRPRTTCAFSPQHHAPNSWPRPVSVSLLRAAACRNFRRFEFALPGIARSPGWQTSVALDAGGRQRFGAARATLRRNGTTRPGPGRRIVHQAAELAFCLKKPEGSRTG